MDPTLENEPPPFNQVDVHSKRTSIAIIAIVLAFFLVGWIGIHKFMLGFNKAGLISLLVTILTFGLAGVVFNILSLVEGIIYLTKTDEEFYQLYIVQKKEWL